VCVGMKPGWRERGTREPAPKSTSCPAQAQPTMRRGIVGGMTSPTRTELTRFLGTSPPRKPSHVGLVCCPLARACSGDSPRRTSFPTPSAQRQREAPGAECLAAYFFGVVLPFAGADTRTDVAVLTPSFSVYWTRASCAVRPERASTLIVFELSVRCDVASTLN
jgi:hypothetical protein